MKFGVFVLAAMAVLGPRALAAPPLVVSTIEEIMRRHINHERARILRESDDKARMIQALRYFKLKQDERCELETLKNLGPPFSVGICPTARNLKLTQTAIAEMERGLKLPEPGTPDGLLLMRYLYLDQVFTEAIRETVSSLEKHHGVVPQVTDLLQLDITISRLKTEIRTLWSSWNLAKTGRVSEAVLLDVNTSADRIARHYEKFLLELSRVPPSMLDHALGFTVSAAIDALIIGFAILVGENPDSIFTWAGLSIFGIVPKAVQIGIWRDWRHVIPFWGTFLRADAFLEYFRVRGSLFSQWAIRSRLDEFSGMTEEDWNLSRTSLDVMCGNLLMALADSTALRAPYGVLPNGTVQFPYPVSVGRFSGTY